MVEGVILNLPYADSSVPRVAKVDCWNSPWYGAGRLQRARDFFAMDGNWVVQRAEARRVFLAVTDSGQCKMVTEQRDFVNAGFACGLYLFERAA